MNTDETAVTLSTNSKTSLTLKSVKLITKGMVDGAIRCLLINLDIRAHFTLMPFVSAAGDLVYTALLIQRGSTTIRAPELESKLDDPRNIGIWYTPKGWMTSECFEEIWMQLRWRLPFHRQQAPLPLGLDIKSREYALATKATDWIVIFLDNHSTHVYSDKVRHHH